MKLNIDQAQTHQRFGSILANNMMAATHRRCRLAWYCFEHDALEVP